MPLRNRAILEVRSGDRTATFEFSDGLEDNSSVAKNLLVGPRGQYTQEVFNQVQGVDPDDAERRAGFTLDGGAGEKERVLSYETGLEDESIMWGDQLSDPGPDSVTITDASGPDVSQYDRQDVFRYWMANSRTDSLQPALLYYNQWSDGTYAIEAGAHGRPMPVVVQEATAETDLNDPTAISGTLRVIQTTELPEFVEDLTDKVEDALDELLDWG